MKYKYIKPIHRYNSDSKRKVTTNESGYLYLMCPECLYMQKIYKQRCTYMELHHSIKDLNYNETISGECPRCKESVIFQEIDFNIARAVDILNEKGYFTAFSCEGHIGNDLDGGRFFAAPYIYFLSDKVLKAMEEHPLPNTWKYETYGKSIIMRSKISNYSDSMSLEEITKKWNQKKEMEDLMEWVDNLDPVYSSEEEYNATKHFFISNSDQIVCENAFYSNNTLGVNL